MEVGKGGHEAYLQGTWREFEVGSQGWGQGGGALAEP